MVRPLPCDVHGETWCGTCAIAAREAEGARRMRRAVVDSGRVLILVGLIVCLLAYAARAEEPDQGVRTIPDRVQCTVPGAPAPVPLPAGGKVVPPEVWQRLDAELKRAQAVETASRGREAELERQYVDRLVQTLSGGLAAGIVVGFVVGWIAKSQPGN